MTLKITQRWSVKRRFLSNILFNEQLRVRYFDYSMTSLLGSARSKYSIIRWYHFHWVVLVRRSWKVSRIWSQQSSIRLDDHSRSRCRNWEGNISNTGGTKTRNDWYRLCIQELPDKIEYCKFTSVAWLPDARLATSLIITANLPLTKQILVDSSIADTQNPKHSLKRIKSVCYRCANFLFILSVGSNSNFRQGGY